MNTSAPAPSGAGSTPNGGVEPPVLDWLDQVQAVAKFIADHELPVINLEAVPRPAPHQDGCHVLVHVPAHNWPAWDQFVWDPVAVHDDDKPQHQAVFHYRVVELAGVRVQLVYLTDRREAVAS